MGKQSRRRRQGRQRTANSILAQTPPLRMSVVTSPGNFQAGQLLTNDIELVRSSILYADTIDLMSVGATMMRSIEELRKGGAQAVLRLIASLSPEAVERLGATPLPTGWRDFIPLVGDVGSLEEAFRAIRVDLPPHLLDQLQSAADQLETVVDQLNHVLTGLLETSGMEELWPAARRRNGQDPIVRLGYVGPSDTPEMRAEELAWVLDNSNGRNRLMHNWLALIRDLVRTDSPLLFDELISNVVTELDRGGLLPVAPSSRRSSAAAAVGTGMVVRLPAFPQARIDELLDVRDEYGEALARYRVAVTKLSTKLSAQAFSPDWREEIEDIWREEVQPAVVQIEDELTDSSFTRELAKSASTEARLLILGGSSVIAAVIPSIAVTSALNVVLGAVGAVGAPAASAAIGAASRSRTEQRQAERNGLAYLVRVNRTLGSREGR